MTAPTLTVLKASFAWPVTGWSREGRRTASGARQDRLLHNGTTVGVDPPRPAGAGLPRALCIECGAFFCGQWPARLPPRWPQDAKVRPRGARKPSAGKVGGLTRNKHRGAKLRPRRASDPTPQPQGAR
jgi:hypothetical protein